jgi:hypothetical protein
MHQFHFFLLSVKNLFLILEMNVNNSNFNVLLKEHDQEDDTLDVFWKEQRLNNDNRRKLF